MAYKHGGTSIAFSNYNYAFLYFNKRYIEICVDISKTLSVRDVRRKVSAFMFEFRYAIPSTLKWQEYRNELDIINDKVNEDGELNTLLEREEVEFREMVQAYPLYYKHFLRYLGVLSRFVTELSSTYMPRTVRQQNLLKYRDDNIFHEKLHEFKSLVFSHLSSFNLKEFRIKVNLFITFFYAYRIFVNEVYSTKIEEVLSLVISLYVNEDSISLFSNYPDYDREDWKKFYKIETHLQDALLYCNSLINLSLSSYGVLPKIEEKVQADRTLI